MTSRIVVGVRGFERPLHAAAGSPEHVANERTHALDWAIALAARQHRPLEIVHALEDAWIGPGYMDDTRLRAAAEALLADARAYALEAAPTITVGTRLLTGDPVLELSDAAPPDGLLVLGAQHLGRVRGAITAPVGVRVAAGARSAVALVPPHPLDTDDDMDAVGGAPEHGAGIVVGVDGSPASLEAIAFAAEEADRAGETLTAVHVWQLPGTWAESIPVERPIIEAIEDDERLLLSESLAGLSARFPGLAIERRLVRGSTVDVLSDAAKGARMLVVGSHGRNALTRLLLGSVSHSLALTMPCPLVVIRHRK